MPDTRQDVIKKWEAAAFTDATGIGVLGLSLELQASGTLLGFELVSAAEIVTVAAGIGIFGGALALAWAPVVAYGLIASMEGSEGSLGDLSKAADAFAFSSAGTLALVPVSSILSPQNDPLLAARVGGPVTDLVTGLSSGTALERIGTALGAAPGFSDWQKDLSNLENYYFPSQPSSNQSPSGSGPAAGPTSPGGWGPGEGSFIDMDFYGPSAPGMGDFSPGSYDGESDTASLPTGTLTFSISVQPMGSSGATPTDDGDANEVETNQNSESDPTVEPEPGPVSEPPSEPGPNPGPDPFPDPDPDPDPDPGDF